MLRAMYDFDKVVERKGTDSLKFDTYLEAGYTEEHLPLWVADMDFEAPPCVKEALHKAVGFGIFGYSQVGEDYNRIVISWFQKNYGWSPKSEWILKTPGVCVAFSMAIRALTKEGEGVLIQPPVYYPFYDAILWNHRKLVTNELIYQDGKYAIDFADFEEKIIREKVKLFILCSPHNPVGRVWKKEELKGMAEICRRHQVFIVSDEIHCDFAFPDSGYEPFLKALPEYGDMALSCTAPSKTFNLAGLQLSNIFIPNEEVRSKIKRELDATGYAEPSMMGVVATKAAYLEGQAWHEANFAYIRENFNYLRAYLEEHIPQCKLIEPQATYLAWVDCTGFGLTGEELEDLIKNKAKLWLDTGRIFGASSECFMRFVLACPRVTLKEALDRLKKAVRSIQ